jgi:FKBP-type peptidyl-prolyl cis-trans isomerase
MPRLRSIAIAAALLPGLWLAGCSDSTTAPTVESATFASSLNIDLSTYTKTASGLYYKDLVVPPAGAAVANGQLVSVHYTGYFTNGKVFDSNPSTATPFAFHLGQNEVIKGWDIGVAGMRVGGQRELIVPPSLGYGSSDYQSIPGNSILVFIVTVVSAK